MSDIQIGPEFVRSGIDAACASFVSPEARHIADGVAQLVASGRPEAYYVPAVRFILDATLSIVETPEIAAQLSPEVADRHTTAIHVAQSLTTIVACKGLFGMLYEQDPTLAEVRMSVANFEALDDDTYLGSLGAAPFTDVGIVAGGALRLLGENGFEGSQARAAITRSKGLLAVGGVHKGPTHTQPVQMYLGLPYVGTDHLVLRGTLDEPRVSFTKDVYDFMARYHLPQGGCPAGKLAAAEGQQRPTLLDNYWERLVEYLIPDHATADVSAS